MTPRLLAVKFCSSPVNEAAYQQKFFAVWLPGSWSAGGLIKKYRSNIPISLQNHLG